MKFRAIVVALFSFLILFAASPARAQNAAVEKQAKALQQKAVQEDYVTTEFAKAEDKLNKAIAMCGADKCSAQLRAQLRRDLGMVLIGGQIDKARGDQAFMDAVKTDPTIQLDPDLKTKELEAAFEAARKKAGVAGGGAAPAGGGAAAGAGGTPAGDFTHTPVTEQAVRTPVPIYVEYAGSEQLVKVLVRYKGFGMTEFKPLELQKVDKGWGGQVPCTDVSQIGQLQYYVQGFNAQNDPVATAGDRNNTYKVPIKAKLEGTEAPHLPGQPPPTQCVDTGDCPPGFPCAKKGGGGEAGGAETGGTKLEGEECEESSECKSNECKNSKCTAPAEAGGKRPKIWIGIAGAIDFTLLSGDNDVCALNKDLSPVNQSSYYCIDGDRDYPSRTDKFVEAGKLQQGKAGSVNSGVAPGNIHLLLSIDYALNQNILLGARLGFVARTYPGSEPPNDGKVLFPPLHIEARFTYLLGKNALTEQKIAPMFLVSGGVSPATAGVDVPVTETSSTGQTNKTVTAYQVGGPGFVALGGGIRVGLTPKAGLLIAPLKVNIAIGNGIILPSLQPEIGAQLGF